MEEIKLIRPQKLHEAAVLDYKEEYFSNGENDLHGSSLLTEMTSYDDWLAHLAKQADSATVSSDWVAATTFLAVRQRDQKIIGMIDIRHYLNDFLREFGGHVGFSVRPTERKKGYATAILRLGLDYCKTLGLERVMLGCYKENSASASTIIKNGGILTKELSHEAGKKFSFIGSICHSFSFSVMLK